MSHIVTLPYDPVWRALEWAKKHCPSYITNQSHAQSKHAQSYDDPLDINCQIDYFFADGRDATLFALKWS